MTQPFGTAKKKKEKEKKKKEPKSFKWKDQIGHPLIQVIKPCITNSTTLT